MKNNYIFFRLHSEEIPNQRRFEKILERYDIEIFIPTFFQLKKHQARGYMYLFWFFFTKGKYRIIYVKKGEKIIHYTHVLPKFFKFPFMHSKDLEIGPAWTAKAYRGEGIFPSVLAYVVRHFKKGERVFYTFAHTDNPSSQSAMQKAEFSKWKKGYKTNYLGIYKVESL